MNIKYFKALWGMTGTLEEQFSDIAKAGYDGIEALLPSKEEESQFKELLEKHQFDYIAQIHTYGDHIESFTELTNRAKEFNPLLINSHSAKDSMTFDEQLNFFEKALIIEKQTGVPIAHETHRGRAMFTPWHTASLLNIFEDLKITADFSHWCCVCESLLQDQVENLSIAIERTIHIHGRVGHAEGPQVSDPSAPEYERELKVHESWWNQIIKQKADQGAKYLTFCPEFGPPGYMQTLPFTGQPVADLWKVCNWMTNRMKANYRPDND
ncbi:sugar phosphate isomerase/epimerase family protein [Neobacillus kokaensis]|uniref:Xylose isomerase-like TIM barrel domain-containing protein n=1 Tax=Neobacillus kokaensis TaxID=2759023 RepID=A0ABQ3N4G2_9BACI|nr:TIM barrel protein [Neobacillus kokaensis]GHH99830.1 hypothetical protein AM1BK_33730 [Neobacillus kokaensis]